MASLPYLNFLFSHMHVQGMIPKSSSSNITLGPVAQRSGKIFKKKKMKVITNSLLNFKLLWFRKKKFDEKWHSKDMKFHIKAGPVLLFI